MKKGVSGASGVRVMTGVVIMVGSCLETGLPVVLTQKESRSAGVIEVQLSPIGKPL